MKNPIPRTGGKREWEGARKKVMRMGEGGGAQVGIVIKPLTPALTHCLYRVDIFSHYSKGSLEVMVDLVDMLVELAVVQQLMYPVMSSRTKQPNN